MIVLPNKYTKYNNKLKQIIVNKRKKDFSDRICFRYTTQITNMKKCIYSSPLSKGCELNIVGV